MSQDDTVPPMTRPVRTATKSVGLTRNTLPRTSGPANFWRSLSLHALLLGLAGCSQPGSRLEPSTPQRSSGKPSGAQVSDSVSQKLDSRIDQAQLNEQLPPFLSSLGQGWGQGYLPSGIVVVSASRQVLFTKSLGSSNFEEAIPFTVETPLLVGDLGQLLLAIITLRLVEVQTLGLEDNLGKYFPNSPSPIAGITIRRLLELRAGFAGLSPSKRTNSRGQTTAQQLEVLWQGWQAPANRNAKTNATRRSSESHLAVLVAVLEKATGLSYSRLLHKEIIAPLALTHTAVQSEDNAQEAAVRYGADPQNGQRLRLPKLEQGHLFSATLVQTSANDLLTILRAISGRALLSESSREALWKEHHPDAAFGGRLGRHRNLRTLRYGQASRGAVGVRSEVLAVPEMNLNILVLSNSAPFDSRATIEAALEATLGQKVEPLKLQRKVERNRDIAEQVRGAYLLNEEEQASLAARGVSARAIVAMATASIFLNKGQIFFKPARQGAMRMVPSGPTSFVLRGGKATLVFDINVEHPDQTSLTLRQGKIAVEYQRKPARQPKKILHDINSSH